MKTKTIGEILQQERQNRQLSLDDLAKLTRIKKSYLESLENNEFQNLPAATFVKGYIQAYGRVFGFDHKPLLALLRRDYESSVKGKLIPREFIQPVAKKRVLWTPLSRVILGLGIVFFVISLYMSVQWVNLRKPPTLVIDQPQENQVVAPQVVVSGRTATDAIVTVNDLPVAIQPDGSFSTQVSFSREGVQAIKIESVDRRGKANQQQRSVRVEY